MIGIFRGALTGMLGQRLRLEVLANNLANVNTPGFKGSRVEFQDRAYEPVQLPAGDTAVVQQPIYLGTGATAVAVQRLFTQADLHQTGNPLDLAIEGDGFFQVLLDDGGIGYTRDGTFRPDGEGRLATPAGHLLVPPLILPPGAQDIVIGRDGTVTARLPGEAAATEAGRVELARFANPGGLLAAGANVFRATDLSGPAQVTGPGDGGAGEIVAGRLEASGVDMAEEVSQMLMAQRAYSLNLEALKTLDQMLASAIQLRR